MYHYTYSVLFRWSARWDVLPYCWRSRTTGHRIQLIKGVYSAYLVQIIEENSAFKIHYQYNQYVVLHRARILKHICQIFRERSAVLEHIRCEQDTSHVVRRPRLRARLTANMSDALLTYCTVNFQCTLGDRYPPPFCWYVRHVEKWYSSKDTSQPITRNIPTHV